MHDNLGAAAINIKGLWEPIVMVWRFDYWHLPSIAHHPAGQIARSIYHSVGIFNAVQTSHWSCHSVQYLLRNSWCTFLECFPNAAKRTLNYTMNLWCYAMHNGSLESRWNSASNGTWRVLIRPVLVIQPSSLVCNLSKKRTMNSVTNNYRAATLNGPLESRWKSRSNDI